VLGVGLVLAIGSVTSIAAKAGTGGAETTRVSVATSGSEANRRAPTEAYPSISCSGRYVAFASRASNLVANDTNRRPDVFVHDQMAGRTERVSVSSSGREARGSSIDPSVSATGRFVAFESDAPNLVNGDHGSRVDVFVHDRRTGRTERASVNWTGNGGNRGSYGPSISADGRFVAFYSRATNLVRRDTKRGFEVFVHDRRTGRTMRVSVSSTGREGNGWSFDSTISATGRFVAFASYATNLAPNDDEPRPDIFVRDRRLGRTELASVNSNGDSGNRTSYLPSISRGGRFVAFYSNAPNLVGGDLNSAEDVFIHDRRTGDTFRVSVSSSGEEGDGPSLVPSISADGRFLAFHSRATNLVSDDGNGRTDVFVHDIQAGETRRVSVSSDGGEGTGNSSSPSISADARFVAFESDASNLVQGDTNERPDVFVRGPLR
jgi:Tol biopolymer transport system component